MLLSAEVEIEGPRMEWYLKAYVVAGLSTKTTTAERELDTVVGPVGFEPTISSAPGSSAVFSSL